MMELMKGKPVKTIKVVITGLAIICAVFLLWGTYQSASAEDLLQIVTAKGTISVFDGTSAPLTLQFNPAGGKVTGSIPEITKKDSESIEKGSITFTGTFSGGDRGTVEGTCKVSYDCNYTAPDEDGFGNMACQLITLAKETCICRWKGTLSANGRGSGSSGCFNETKGSLIANLTGDWQVTFPAGVISGSTAAPEEQSEALVQEVQPEEQPAEEAPAEESPIDIPDADTISGVEIQEAIALERKNSQNGYTRSSAAQLITWNGMLVSVNIDSAGQPYLEDVSGNRVAVDDMGDPLEEDYELQSPASKVIKEHPNVDWVSTIADYNNKVVSVINTIGQPDMELVKGTFSRPQPGSLLTRLHDIVGIPSALGIIELDNGESQGIQAETYSLQTSATTTRSASEVKQLMDKAIKEALKANTERFREDVVKSLAEAYNQPDIEEPKVPAEVTNEFYNRVINIIGKNKLDELVEETGLDPKAAADLEKKLRKMGVKDEELTKTINAVQAIRVLGNMGKGHTVATSGTWDKIFTFIDRWTANRAATEAVINDPELQMSKEQMEMIQDSIRDMNVFEEGVENFAVNQFKDQVIELIQEQAENQLKGDGD